MLILQCKTKVGSYINLKYKFLNCGKKNKILSEKDYNSVGYYRVYKGQTNETITSTPIPVTLTGLRDERSSTLPDIRFDGYGVLGSSRR